MAPTRFLLLMSMLTHACSLNAAVISEEFTGNPWANGWHRHGDASLFQWLSDPGELAVTWDSEQTNSYACLPLGTVLSKDDDFTLAFDLELREVSVGFDQPQTYSFEIAAGFIRIADATAPGFRRGSGTQSPNLVEFDYFPDTGFGATISPAVVSSNSVFATSFTFPLEMGLHDRFRIEMAYASTNQTLVTTMTRNGEPFGPIEDVVLGPAFTDFRVDAFSFSSYADHATNGSLLVRGIADNVVIGFPDPKPLELEGRSENGIWTVTFDAAASWTYTLHRTGDFETWETAAMGFMDNDGLLTLQDPDPPDGAAFYRVLGTAPPGTTSP
jgi:hypothetical protein